MAAMWHRDLSQFATLSASGQLWFIAFVIDRVSI
jgi:hypothetical protein